MTINEIFAANLRRRRLELGLTQRALAERISYSEKAISKWESGAGLPPSAILPALAYILRVGIDEMMREGDSIEYYIGVDCGGYKTEFVLVDGEGDLINRILLGATNSNEIPYTDMQNTIYEGIFEVLRDISPSKVSLYVGTSGSTHADEHRLYEFLSGCAFGRVQVGSNIVAAIRLCLGETGNGIVVNLGAGSVAFGRADGDYYHCGGYGYILGDACSGFELAKEAISAVLRYEDGIGPYTLLYDYFSDAVDGIGDVDKHYNFLMRFYKEGKSSVARYAPLLFRAIRNGDEVAMSILRENVYEVAQMIRALARRMRLPRVKVALCGGILKAEDCILPILRSYLAEDAAYEYELETYAGSLVGGALYLAGLDPSRELPRFGSYD